MTIKGDKVIPIASDHAGFRLKGEIIRCLQEAGYSPLDLGTDSEESVDYPDFGRLVAERISRGDNLRGILICGSGIGISIVANKFRGVRAAPCCSVEAAKLSRQHNDSNILVLGERLTGKELALEILNTWLVTSFNGGRHERRLKKISEIEDENFR